MESVTCDNPNCPCSSGRKLIGLEDRLPAVERRQPTPSQRAAELVSGPRQKAYGHPHPNHDRIAAFWNVRLRDKLSAPLEPHEVAACMRLVKEARLMETRGHRDSLDDIAGYADVEFLIHDFEAGGGGNS